MWGASSMGGITGPGRVVRVAISDIYREPDGWPRRKLDLERVEEFSQLYADQGLSALPLIEVVPDGGGGFLLAEGHHRFEALSRTNVEELDVSVLTLAQGADPLEACFERGLVTAATSPLRLTRAEKHDAIVRLAETRPDLSHHQIGGLVGVSHQTVGRVLEQSNGPAEEPDAGPLPPTDLEVARHLFAGIEKVYEARGLGVWDALTGDHTGKRLAGVLADSYGEDALERAEQFRAWCDEAVRELGGRSR